MTTHLNNLLLTTALLLATLTLAAQSPTQTLRGTVTDNISQMPLPGATVALISADPITGVNTDLNGNFKFAALPVGKHTLRISYIGYKDQTLNNVNLDAGKELVLTIVLEEDFTLMKEVEIKAEQNKSRALNEMAQVSARSFSVEETQRYAAAVNDPARMVTAFAGVVGADDGNNSISIRGNSPNGLLWRMEGVDIPNPNHYANTASSGGGIMILSAQLLSNSDFMTGAFPAEYGNALAGVFDIRLRKGNNAKREYTFQAGVLGIDAAAEGPIRTGYDGSFLINYRYSTLSVLGLMNLGLPAGTLDFQDLSFNVYLPTAKAGNFTIFGFGGLSSQKVRAEADSSEWEFDYNRYSSTFISNTGAAGLKHGKVINSTTFLQSTCLFSGTESKFEDARLNDLYIPEPQYEERFAQGKITLTSSLSKKWSPRLHSKTGFFVNRLQYEAYMQQFDLSDTQTDVRINTSGNTISSQLYTQWSYKVTERLTLNGGVHGLHLAVNNTASLEPRASVSYALNEKRAISFGYGLHGQIQPLANYFIELPDEAGNFKKQNEDLEMTKSHHFVAGYTQALSSDLHLKVETYYQHLFNIPIAVDPSSTYALINQEWGFADQALRSDGIGRNMGLEFTLEQFLKNNFYYMVSASLYDAKYRAADGNWYDTRHNGGHALAITGGKEFPGRKSEKHRTYGVNLRSSWNGGFRTTPIDLEASRAEGRTVSYDELAFTEKLPDYFRIDLRLSMKRQREKTTHTLSLDVQNVTNRQNVFNHYYDPELGEVRTFYQVGILPILAYRVQF